MGKKKICEKCGKKYKDSWKEKAKKKGVIDSLRMIRIAGIKEKKKELKDYCFPCWDKEIKSMLKPFAQALGQSAEGW